MGDYSIIRLRLPNGRISLAFLMIRLDFLIVRLDFLII